MAIKLVKGKCGCQGCIYEDKDTCPADDKVEGLNACSDGDESMIFVEVSDE